MWYHASKSHLLEHSGIFPGIGKGVSRTPMPHVYLGSRDYLEEQYFSYCSDGLYYLYEVDTQGLQLDTTPVGEQCRLPQVSPDRVILVGCVRVTRSGYKYLPFNCN